MPPFFTIITATYNAAATLPRLLESLAAQTCRDFVWVAQDGASNDDTLAVIEQWRERLDLVLIARQSHRFALSPEDGVERRGAHTAIWTFCASHPCGVSFTGRGAAGTTAGAGLPVEAGGFGKSSPKTSPQ